MTHPTKSHQNGPRKLLDHLVDALEVCDDLVEQIDNMSLALDDVKQTLADLAQKHPKLNALLQPAKGKGRRKEGQPGQPVMYASSVTLNWGSASATIVIDGQSLSLPPKLGILLEILLAEDSSPAADPRKGWKTREDLALQMGKKTGSPVTRHALDNLISRLKKKLRDQAGLEALVQSDRRLGVVRFALQKHAAEPIQAPFKSIQTAA